LYVCDPFLYSANGYDTDMRPVSLEPVGPGGVSPRRNLPEKWPFAKLPKNGYDTKAFLCENLALNNAAL
jgi:hypothetical protein